MLSRKLLFSSSSSHVVLSDNANGYVIADAIQVIAPNAQPNTATWTLNAGGEQQVYAKWTSHPNRASNAIYTVHHAHGSTDITVNQQQNGAQWNLLGSFILDADSRVTLSDQANGYVIADAIALQSPYASTGNTALWSSLVSIQGNYEVYAKWTAHPNRAGNATYTVTHANGSSNVTVNQKTSGGQWILLGSYSLNSQSTVSLSSDADGYVIADAIRISGDAVVGNAHKKVYYYHNDHLGTPQTLTDETQAVVWQGHYSPFGEIVTSVETVENNLRFAGQYFDIESGLHYNYHRYYDPSLGRYITSDPIGLDGGLNTYGYVAGNPLSFIDPFGLAPNQLGATDPEYVRDYVRRLKDTLGLDDSTTMLLLSQNHSKNNNNRYIYTEKYGWIDIRHFGRAAQIANKLGSEITEALGFGKEVEQWCNEWGDKYRSGFSPEDIPSNAAGSDFGDNYMGIGPNINHDLWRWMRDVGARSADDPISGKNKLPYSDPSGKGGKGRGDSNVSHRKNY